MTNHEQLQQLEPIMRQLGIWPDNLTFSYDELHVCVMHKFTNPITKHEGVMVIGNDYALAIVRDIAERWLKGHTDCLGPNQNLWADAGSYWWQDETGMTHTRHSLPAALEYAEQLRSNK